MRNLLHEVAIVGTYNTRQARVLSGETTSSLLQEAIAGALADSGLTLDDVDGLAIDGASDTFVYQLGLGPAWHSRLAVPGIVSVIDAASAVVILQSWLDGQPKKKD